MSESHDVHDSMLTAFLVRVLDRIPQDARNRYAKRVETMGARLIARMIVSEMRRAHWRFKVPVRDPEASQSSYNRNAAGDG